MTPKRNIFMVVNETNQIVHAIGSHRKMRKLQEEYPDLMLFRHINGLEPGHHYKLNNSNPKDPTMTKVKRMNKKSAKESREYEKLSEDFHNGKSDAVERNKAEQKADNQTAKQFTPESTKQRSVDSMAKFKRDTDCLARLKGYLTISGLRMQFDQKKGVFRFTDRNDATWVWGPDEIADRLST
jgi:hypothetical protein